MLGQIHYNYCVSFPEPVKGLMKRPIDCYLAGNIVEFEGPNVVGSASVHYERYSLILLYAQTYFLSAV